jgi:hypothetical protein
MSRVAKLGDVMSGPVPLATPGQRLTEIDAMVRSEVTTAGFEVDATAICIGVAIAARIELPVTAKLLHLVPAELISVLLLRAELVSVLLLPAELILIAFAFSQMHGGLRLLHFCMRLLLEPSTVHRDAQKPHARPAAGRGRWSKVFFPETAYSYRTSCPAMSLDS